MKKILTLGMMWLTTLVFGQGVQLNVGIQDGCGHLFPHEATLELYKIWNGDTSLVEAVTTHPVVFNGLEKNVKYTLKVSTQTAAIQDPSLVDVLSMRNVILGSENFSLANILAGDLNDTGGLSTLDLVHLSREIIKLTDNIQGDWFFIEQSKALIKTWGPDIKEYINQAPFQVSDDGSYELFFNAYQYGHVGATLPSNCVSCEPVAGSVARILVPNIEVEKGKKYTVPVKYEIQPKDAGTAFALKYENIEVTNVGRLNADIHHSKSINTIYSIYAFYNLDESQELVMYTMDFTALQDGKNGSFLLWHTYGQGYVPLDSAYNFSNAKKWSFDPFVTFARNGWSHKFLGRTLVLDNKIDNGDAQNQDNGSSLIYAEYRVAKNTFNNRLLFSGGLVSS
ncbi:MAG TPA: hypothetical protein PLV12_11865, partial [Saprospiraceae bacterium]|nr:hypothetical protein [Saprospiraceae bacterium]